MFEVNEQQKQEKINKINIMLKELVELNNSLGETLENNIEIDGLKYKNDEILKIKDNLTTIKDSIEYKP